MRPGFTKESMADDIEARVNAVEFSQFEGDAAGLQAYRRQLLEAWCQGLIDALQNDGRVRTTSGAPDGEHLGQLE